VKILMESTDYLVKIGGVECRVWNGVTENNTQVFVMVHRLMLGADEDQLEFGDLLEQSPSAVQVPKPGEK
jgi:hypothetical protein